MTEKGAWPLFSLFPLCVNGGMASPEDCARFREICAKKNLTAPGTEHKIEEVNSLVG
ncbi:hypothetical protein Daudx_2137 [Candidatus Desulforudis audaxviator]|nr:hypothetical protein Daudx_2137 [Candidatus Desulforudis audaxviator]